MTQNRIAFCNFRNYIFCLIPKNTYARRGTTYRRLTLFPNWARNVVPNRKTQSNLQFRALSMEINGGKAGMGTRESGHWRGSTFRIPTAGDEEVGQKVNLPITDQRPTFRHHDSRQQSRPLGPRAKIFEATVQSFDAKFQVLFSMNSERHKNAHELGIIR